MTIPAGTRRSIGSQLAVKPRGRLVLIGSIVMDMLLYVDRLPERGSDVVASMSQVSPGGGFNILSSARKLGMEAAYGGLVGSGPNGAAIEGALDGHGIERLLPRRAGSDNGFVVGAVEPSGERTFVTVPGCESMIEPAHLLAVQELLRPDDTVYISGYEFLYHVSGPTIASWIAGAGETWPVAMDPGPLVGELPGSTFFNAIRACKLLTLNEREAKILLQRSSPAHSQSSLPGHAEPSGEAGALDVPAGQISPSRISSLAAIAEALHGEYLNRDAIVIVRAGSLGCVIYEGGDAGIYVPGRFAGEVVDTTGAGDVHTAAFLSAYYSGEHAVDAARVANVAASMSVSVRGGASSPSVAELASALQGIKSG